MLARLDRIDGVKRSYANRSGTLVRLSLAPGADPDAVARAAGEVLNDDDDPAPPAPLSDPAAAEAVGREEWRDAGRAHELSDIERRTVWLRGLAALLAVCGLVAGVVWYRRRRRSRSA